MKVAQLYYRLIKFEHTIFALPFAYVGAFLAVSGVPSAHDLLWITVAMVGARSLAMALNRLIDAGIDAANPRTASRELPSGALTAAAVVAFCAVVARRLPRRRLAARPARPLALAGAGRRLRRLPVPEAVHLALPPLARRRRRPRARRRLGGDQGRPAVAGLGARRRGRRVGRRLRPLLCALRRRRRPRAGPALVGDALRRARRVRRRTRAAPDDDRAARRGRARRCTSAASTGSASRSSRDSCSTSTRSCGPTTCVGSTPRSSR